MIRAGDGSYEIAVGKDNDSVRLGNGNSTVSAGEGSNRIYAGDGNLVVTAGGGADQIKMGDGTGQIDAGGGKNQITAGDGDFVITAEEGDDQIKIGDGTSQIDAGDGSNRITTGDGQFLVTTGSGNDQLRIGDAEAELHLGDGNNRATLGAGTFTITSGTGNDQITVSDGTLDFSSLGGNNRITAGSGDMSIVTGDGTDNIRLGDGTMVVDAGAGQNRITAGHGIFEIAVGDGNDSITLRDGTYTIFAGAGTNRVSLGNGDLVLSALGGDDDIRLGDGSSEISVGEGRNRVTASEGIHVITAGDGNNQIKTDDGEVTVSLGDGDNRVDTGDGSASVAAGDGNNRITVGEGTALVEVGDGNNRIVTGEGEVTILTGDGRNTIRLSRGGEEFNSTVTTGAGNDSIVAGDGTAVIDSGAGRDTIRLGSGDATVDAGAGDDQVYGGTASDYIVGGAGNDRLDGRTGTDWAAFSGSFSDYYIKAVNGSTVQVSAVSTDVSDFGIDQLRNIEFLYFAGDGVTLDISDRSVVERLYEIVLSDDRVATASEDPLQISLASLLANDTSMGFGTATYQVSATSASGVAISFDGTNITYNSEDALRHLTDGEVFTDSFTYTVTDANGNSDTATVNVTVTGQGGTAEAADDRLVGSDFLIAEYHTDSPYAWQHRATRMDDGGFALAYVSHFETEERDERGNPLAASQIRLHVFDASGSVVERGIELFTAETGVGIDDLNVTTLENGNLAVSWTYGRYNIIAGPNSYAPFSSWVQVFDPSGTPLFEPLEIDGNRPDGLRGPWIEALDNGNFVISQVSQDPVFGSDGRLVDSIDEWRFSVVGQDGSVIASSAVPDVGYFYVPIALPDGQFAVVHQDGSYAHTFMTFYDETGNELSQTVVTAGFEHRPYHLEAEVNDAGLIALTWIDNGGRLMSQILDLDGNTLVDRWIVDTMPEEALTGHLEHNYFKDLQQVWLDDGRFAVIWNEAEKVPGTYEYISFPYVIIFDAEGQPLTDKIAIDPDGERGHHREIEIVALPEGGFAIISQDLNPETGDHDTTIRIFDGNGELAERAFTDQNTASLISIDQLLANDTGAEGAELTVTDVSATSAFGAEITFNAETGEVLYDPTASAEVQALGTGETLEDTFTYTLTDANGNTSTATVTLTVGGTDGVPITVPNAIDDRLTGAPSNLQAIEGEGEFTLSGIGVATSPHPQVVARKDGGFVSAWKANSGGQTGVAVRVVDAEGNDVRSLFLANEDAGGRLDEFELTELEDGGFALVWRTNGSNNPDVDTRSTMRIFNADGSPRTGEISLVNSEGDDFASFRVTGLSNGNILVTSIGTTYPSGAHETRSGFDGRIYSPNGDILGQSFAMDLDDFPGQGALQGVSVEALETGGFITLWATGTIGAGRSTTVVQAEIFDNSGQEVVTNLELTTRTIDANLGALSNVQVSANENGSFVVTWREISTDAGIEARMVGRVFNPDGSAASEEFTFYRPVVAGTTDYADNGDVTWVSAEQFVVTWSAPDSSRGGTYAQVYNADGTPATESVLVNESEHYHQIYSSIAPLNDGRFIISWYSNEDSTIGIKAQIFGGNHPYATEDSIATIKISDLLSNDTGFDGDSFVFSLDGAVSANGASLSYDADTGLITYDPTAAADIQALNDGDVLEDSFVYSITDAEGATSEATVTLVVGGLDEFLS